MTENEKRLILIQSVSNSGSALSSLSFTIISDQESSNPEMSSDGGDYSFWRVIANWNGKPVAVSYRTSCSGFDYCTLCGTFATHDPDKDCPTHAEEWELLSHDNPVHQLDDDRVRMEINRLAWNTYYVWLQ